ncbi:unnamed protein product [Lactuca virosa]|uniref:Uncharacterized protein n=1 Tax=Lactuca virosa TaxID=75947 RepID=A0AAU9LPI3_9ASTR|nr:unnamed protein product [Lactuca virosa]
MVDGDPLIGCSDDDQMVVERGGGIGLGLLVLIEGRSGETTGVADIGDGKGGLSGDLTNHHRRTILSFSYDRRTRSRD